MKEGVFTLLLLCLSVCGQGTFFYDQESSMDETAFQHGAGGTIQQIPTPFGQSFTPTIAAVNFIRLNLNDNSPNNGLGATLYVNLRTNSIGGPLLASTMPVTLTNGFTGVANFFFSSSVQLTPNEIYYFEPVVQSGDLWNAISGEYNYPGGTAFYQGLALSGGDYWFREGIYVVPEPLSMTLVFICGGLALWVRRKPNAAP